MSDDADCGKGGTSKRDRLREAAFDHYGRACACCGTTHWLGIDHVDGRGQEHRAEIGENALHYWLAEHRYPDGFQTLCGYCNSSKGRRETCTIDHSVDKRPFMPFQPPVSLSAAPCGTAAREGFPPFAGIAEVAALAGVSRARAGQLTQKPGFPEPLQELAMGPVWIESEVTAFLAVPRKAGRPSKGNA